MKQNLLPTRPLCRICHPLRDRAIDRPLTLISCFGVLSSDNEPVCSKSNYPFRFLALRHRWEDIHYALPHTTPNATGHIKGAL